MSIEPLDLTNRYINSSQDNLRFEAGVKWYFSKVEPYGLAFNCQENLVNHSQKTFNDQIMFPKPKNHLLACRFIDKQD